MFVSDKRPAMVNEKESPANKVDIEENSKRDRVIRGCGEGYAAKVLERVSVSMSTSTLNSESAKLLYK